MHLSIYSLSQSMNDVSRNDTRCCILNTISLLYLIVCYAFFFIASRQGPSSALLSPLHINTRSCTAYGAYQKTCSR
jgi:hypothetical protein